MKCNYMFWISYNILQTKRYTIIASIVFNKLKIHCHGDCNHSGQSSIQEFNIYIAYIEEKRHF